MKKSNDRKFGDSATLADAPLDYSDVCPLLRGSGTRSGKSVDPDPAGPRARRWRAINRSLPAGQRSEAPLRVDLSRDGSAESLLARAAGGAAYAVVSPRIAVVVFADATEMNLAMARVWAYSGEAGRDVAGTALTLGEIDGMLVSRGSSLAEWSDKWGGWQFPRHAVVDCLVGPTSGLEGVVLEAAGALGPRGSVVATYVSRSRPWSGTGSTLVHELAHAAWDQDLVYRHLATLAVETSAALPLLASVVDGVGYAPEYVMDERQAYLLQGDVWRYAESRGTRVLPEDHRALHEGGVELVELLGKSVIGPDYAALRGLVRALGLYPGRYPLG